MLGVYREDSRLQDDGETTEAAVAPERTQRRAQPMSLAQLLAAKRAASGTARGSSDHLQELPYERVELVTTLPRPLPRAVTYSDLQRRLAEQRERLRNESAVTIQRCFRRYQHRCYIHQCRAILAAEYDERRDREVLSDSDYSEQELLCDSVLIPMTEVLAIGMEMSRRELVQLLPPPPPIRDSSAAASPLHTQYEEPPLPVLPPVPPPIVAGERLPEYLVDVELVSARGLLSESAMFAGGVVDFELSLCSADGDAVSKRAATRALQAQTTSSGSMVETVMAEDTSIQFTSETDDGMAGPQTIVDGWSVRVVAKVRSARGRETQGNLNVPLVLLETGLASDYALCRWFPLEKASPGDLTRGELRLSLRVLVRACDASGLEVMTPYTPPKREDSPHQQKVATNKAKPRKALPTRRVKRPQRSVTKTTEQKTTHASTQPGEDSQPTDRLATRVVSLPSPDLRPMPRVEAISPPSSPASTSSSDTMTSPTPLRHQPHPTRRSLSTEEGQERALQARVCKSSARRVSLAERMGRMNDTRRSAHPTIGGSSSGHSDEDMDDDDGSSQARRPFLKRKPFKVVFQRLDWSSVPSKTDSRLGTAVTTSIEKPGAKKNRPGGSSSPSSDLGARSDGRSSASIDVMTRKRLEQLEVAMRACCGVSDCCDSLIPLRYQTERKKFAVTQAKRVQAMQPDASNTSASCVEEVWQRLAADATGEFYAKRLHAVAGWADEAAV